MCAVAMLGHAFKMVPSVPLLFGFDTFQLGKWDPRKEKGDLAPKFPLEPNFFFVSSGFKQLKTEHWCQPHLPQAFSTSVSPLSSKSLYIYMSQ